MIFGISHPPIRLAHTSEYRIPVLSPRFLFTCDQTFNETTCTNLMDLPYDISPCFGSRLIPVDRGKHLHESIFPACPECTFIDVIPHAFPGLINIAAFLRGYTTAWTVP